MAKYHINSKGEPAKCTAETKACPLGGEHYESVQDAAMAVMEAEFNAANPEPMPKPPTAKERFAALGDDELVSDEDREELYGVFLKNLDRDFRGVGITHFGAAGGGAMEGLSDAEFSALLEAQQKPIRLLPAEKKRRDEVCRAHKVSPEDVEAWATEVEPLTATWRGEKVAFHPSRHLIKKDIMGSLQGSQRTMGFTAENAANAARWKRDKLVAKAEGAQRPTREDQIADLEKKARVAHLMAQSADTRKEGIEHTNERTRLLRQISDLKAQQPSTPPPSSTDRDPSHPYGPRKAKEEDNSGGSGPRAKKELDPAMLEALKMKYLKKFKIPFEDSGLSVGELLQMAQKGELG